MKDTANRELTFDNAVSRILSPIVDMATRRHKMMIIKQAGEDVSALYVMRANHFETISVSIIDDLWLSLRRAVEVRTHVIVYGM